LSGVLVRVLLIGSGVIGTVYGAALAAGGAEVTVLERRRVPTRWLR